MTIVDHPTYRKTTLYIPMERIFNTNICTVFVLADHPGYEKTTLYKFSTYVIHVKVYQHLK